MKTKKQFLSILLSLIMVLGLMPGMGLTAYADTSYNLWVGGVEVTSSNHSGNGWSFSSDSNTLTLTNYSYTGDGGTKYSGIYYNGSSDLTVSLTGDNAITINNNSGHDSHGIYFYAPNNNLKIVGEGNLNIAFGTPNGTPNSLIAIRCEGNFIMGGTGTVNAHGGQGNESYGLFSTRNVTFNSGIFQGEGSTTTKYESRGIGTSYTITVNGGTVRGIAPLNNGTYSAYGFQNGSFVINDGTLISQGKTPFRSAYDDKFSAGTGKQLVIQGGTSDSDLSDKSKISDTSGCTYVKLTVIDAHKYSVTITPGSNMTNTSGDATQTDLSGAMADVVYTADDRYYFPEGYSVAAVNGISVTRNSYTQITVSGTPTADAAITLPAPTAKTTPEAPTTAAATDCTTADNNDGKLTGITTAMEYKKSDADSWTAGTGSDIENLVPGTYYVRVKATDTTNASENQELTIKGFISYTVTLKVVNGSWDEGEGDAATADKTVTLTGHDGDSLKLAVNQIPTVGTKPNDSYKAGSWDTTPSADTAITEATTYTYTYAAKEASVVTRAPEVKTLTYNGQAQELVTAGEATGGEMQYALGKDATTAPTDGWNTSIPARTNAGTYYVWYKAKGDENHYDSDAKAIEVKIGEAVTPSIAFDTPSMNLKIGDERSIKVIVVPEDAKITWTSDKEAVATVDTTGTVKAVSEGTATITGKITVDGKDYSAECKVTVSKPTPEPTPTDISVTLNLSETYLTQGMEKALKATTKPEGSTVTWSSSDNSVAYVDERGVVIGLKPGTATITAKITVDGKEYSASCKVTVVPAGTPIIIPSGGGEHTHKFVWVTIEATEDSDGELRYQCETCGDIKERVPLTAYNVFNKNTTEKIRNAKKDATVKIETNKWISFHKMVMEALAERKDVTLEISFLDGEYKGNRYTVVIPKGTDTMSLVDKNGFTGFLYLGGKFGMKTN